MESWNLFQFEMVLFRTSLILLCIFIVIVAQEPQGLSLQKVCNQYVQCHRQVEQIERKCLEMHRTQRNERPEKMELSPYTVDEDFSPCGLQLHSEYSFLRDAIRQSRAETVECLRNSTKAGETVGGEKTKFCSVYMGDIVPSLPDTTARCWLGAKRMTIRCNALAKCCGHANRCESESKHSQLGKEIGALREELSLRLAECKQYGKEESEVRRKPVNREERLNNPIKHRTLQEVSPNVLKTLQKSHEPVFGRTRPPPRRAPTLRELIEETNVPLPEKEVQVLCARYLQCERDLVLFRNKCNAAGGVPRSGRDYSWSVAYMHMKNSIDKRDEQCKGEHEPMIADIQQKQAKAEEYMRECVKTVNVTQEIKRKGRTCTPLLIRDIPMVEPIGSTCREDLIVRKTQCNYLRDCCPHADVCERAPLYSALADDYLMAIFSLRDKMNRCYLEVI